MRFYLSLFFLFLFQLLFSQEITQRLIIFGDAGEINSKQSFLIQYANKLTIKDKTKAFFIGDNIYPSGMGLTAAGSEETGNILRSQFEGFRSLNVPVYFLAGNHDWDHSGKNGLAKLKAQEEFLHSFNDKDLRFLPKAGMLTPEIIQITDKVVAIVYDSEFWLFPHHNKSIDTEKDQFIEDLRKMVNENLDKTILMISHHPMVTYGDHSLIYSWKDHIFPLTDAWPPLYIPLPGIGSLYPLFRTHVTKSPEDIKHPLYQELIQRATSITENHPKVLFISGHDHGLQYIEKGKIRQVVSGSGSKQSHIHKRKPLKYGYNKQGFSMIDILEGNEIKVVYYIDNPKDSLTKSYETVVDFKDKP